MFYVVISFNTSRAEDSVPIPVKDVRSERLRRVNYFKIVKHGSWRPSIQNSGEISFKIDCDSFVFKNMFVFIIK
jgi:hypothetical protein